MRTAPEQTETVPGLRDNALLRAALGRVGDAPQSQALLDVARQLLQGHVFLRVKGDARTLLAEGKGLPLAVANAGERTFALVFSSGAALQASLKADGDTDTSAMGQPVLIVLRHVLGSSYDGIIIDPASAPSRAVLPKELLQRAVDQADPQLTVKTLLAAERTPDIGPKVAEALTRVPLWVAVGTAENGAPGLAEGRDASGARFLEIYSHPLEVAVMGRGDNAAPITAAQLSRALASDEGITGVVVDPAGPWIRLTRDELVAGDRAQGLNTRSGAGVCAGASSRSIPRSLNDRGGVGPVVSAFRLARPSLAQRPGCVLAGRGLTPVCLRVSYSTEALIKETVEHERSGAGPGVRRTG